MKRFTTKDTEITKKSTKREKVGALGINFTICSSWPSCLRGFLKGDHSNFFSAVFLVFFLVGMFFSLGCWISGSIHDAAKNGKREVVQRWLTMGNNIEEKDLRGWTPLHCAADGGQKEIVEFLLTQGANPNSRNDIGNTPLHEASYKGQLEIVKVLVNKGADKNLKAVDGKTPADLARQNGQNEVADYLMPPTTPEKKQ